MEFKKTRGKERFTGIVKGPREFEQGLSALIKYMDEKKKAVREGFRSFAFLESSRDNILKPKLKAEKTLKKIENEIFDIFGVPVEDFIALLLNLRNDAA